MPSTPSISDDKWDACITSDDEPIVGVVIDHPIPQTHFGFDFGPGGKVYIAETEATLENGHWVAIGNLCEPGIEFNDAE